MKTYGSPLKALVNWKMGNIAPIFQKGGKEDPGNYQPIGLTSAWEDHRNDPPGSYAKAHGDRELIRDSQPGFTESKSCPTNLVTFYDGVTTSVEKGRATDVVYLDFNKVFDMVPQNVILSKLERYEFDGWTVQWMRNWLDGP